MKFKFLNPFNWFGKNKVEGAPVEVVEEYRQLIYSAIKTPDGTLLVSRGRYDYMVHEDTITGKKYGVDGGLSYRRYIGDVFADCEVITHYADEPHEIVRDFMSWGTYGKNGDQPLKYVRVKEMSDAHINNIVGSVHGGNWAHKILKEELKYRKANNITIVD